MNKHGQAARFAYNPAALVAYLDTLERPACYTDAHHGRIIRRWRRSAKGVTLTGALCMVQDFGGSDYTFRKWCTEQGVQAVLRNRVGL